MFNIEVISKCINIKGIKYNIFVIHMHIIIMIISNTTTVQAYSSVYSSSALASKTEKFGGYMYGIIYAKDTKCLKTFGTVWRKLMQHITN